MKPWEKFIKLTNGDKGVLDAYTQMRMSLQDFNIHEWQLEKGYRIPGTIYEMRAITLAEMTKLVADLQKYGILPEEEHDKFKEYILSEYKKIDELYPLQKGDKPDFMYNED